MTLMYKLLGLAAIIAFYVFIVPPVFSLPSTAAVLVAIVALASAPFVIKKYCVLVKLGGIQQ